MINDDVVITGSLTVDDPAFLSGINITNPAGGINMGGSNIFSANNVTASGTIQGGTLESTGETQVGTKLTVGGNLDMTNGDVTQVKNIKGDGTGTISDFASISGGTLSTSGDASIGGNLDMTNGNINNVATLTAVTVKATDVNATNVKATNGTFTTLKTTGDATVGGDLTVTQQSNLNGGVIVGNHLTVASGTKVSMGNNVVHDVADPVLGTDAANKQYVDAGLSRAFRDIDRNTQGIAIAMAMGGMALPDSKNFALGANLGFFDSKQAMAIQGAMRLTPFVSVNGGIGMGLDDSSTLGGRVGVQVAW